MSAPVLIFDSGVGGLSVARSLALRHPDIAQCYACDNAWLPYGLRDDVTLSERILAVCRAAVAACGAGALVVACNTASTLALDRLRATLPIPVIGTVPAIKPAALASRTRHIGLLATTATVNRPYTQDLIERFASDCRVSRVAADPLVVQAETWLAGGDINRELVHRALAPLWQATALSPALDTVVLGCTHFPLLKPMLESLAPVPLGWVDSGDAIARRVAEVAAHCAGRRDGRCFTTAAADHLVAGFAEFGFTHPRRLALP